MGGKVDQEVKGTGLGVRRKAPKTRKRGVTIGKGRGSISKKKRRSSKTGDQATVKERRSSRERGIEKQCRIPKDPSSPPRTRKGKEKNRKTTIGAKEGEKRFAEKHLKCPCHAKRSSRAKKHATTFRKGEARPGKKGGKKCA